MPGDLGPLLSQGLYKRLIRQLLHSDTNCSATGKEQNEGDRDSPHRQKGPHNTGSNFAFWRSRGKVTLEDVHNLHSTFQDSKLAIRERVFWSIQGGVLYAPTVWCIQQTGT